MCSAKYQHHVFSGKNFHLKRHIYFLCVNLYRLPAWEVWKQDTKYLMIYISIISWDVDASFCIHCCPWVPSLLCAISPSCRTAERSQPETEIPQSKTSAVLRSYLQLFQITAVHSLLSDTDHREHMSLSSFSSLLPRWQPGQTLPFQSRKQTGFNY